MDSRVVASTYSAEIRLIRGQCLEAGIIERDGSQTESQDQILLDLQGWVTFPVHPACVGL